jgi:S-adenosylmethionine hydrolase
MVWITRDPPIITLTTDFGLADSFVGVMKGVILGLAPRAQLIDITHDIRPQNIVEAAVRLASAYSYFPAGTVHLVVVDPGVGSDRAACVVQTPQYRFVAPDNGVLTMMARHEQVQQFVRLGPEAKPYLRHPVSATFHGRDVFAPVAAQAALGIALERLGRPLSVEAMVAAEIPEPYRLDANRMLAPVLFSDRFGNMITALTRQQLAAWMPGDLASMMVQAGEYAIQGIARTYSDVEPGELVAYFGSDDRLEIAIRNGSAADALGSDAEIVVGW